MAKLYPPYVEGKLPAQSGTVLKIPFRLNRTVSIKEVDCVVARIKTVSTSTWKGTLPEIEVPDDAYVNYIYDTKTQNYYVEIPTESLNLSIGQYYKVQLAFYNKVEGLGYFSSVGVFKYSAIPNVYILSLDKNNRNANRYSYVGVYNQQGGDPTEKIYSYCFEIKEVKTDKVIASSGTQLHNSSEDENSYESRDEFNLEEELQMGILYSITYKTTSMNNLEVEASYYIQRTDVIFDPLEGTMIAENDYDNGCVNLTAYIEESKEDFGENRGFIVSRACSKDNYSTWTDLFKFTVNSHTPFPEEIGRDFTTEQGFYYRYAIQRYQMSGVRTERLEIAEPLLSDFEDVFLFDKYRQLKIRFNTKVTSFKSTILETKIDTLGGQYPFIFRNGTIEYKEFPISGLISYLSDNDELFMSNAELGFMEEDAFRLATVSPDFNFRVRSTQVDTMNILAERNFKMSVLDWLTNGEPKLFRSPSEGNYIVRLMNVSLTPNDTLGRMLHTFTATAYEIADYNHFNLVKYGFIEEKENVDNALTYSSITLKPNMVGTKLSFYELNGAHWCLIRDVPPGTKLKLNFMDGKGDVEVVIGSTGTYEVNIYDYPLISIEIVGVTSGLGLKGYIDYAYRSKVNVDDFSPIRNVVFSLEWGQAFGEIVNAIYPLENIKYKIDSFDYLKVELKEGATPDSEIQIDEDANYNLHFTKQVGEYITTTVFRPGQRYYVQTEPRRDLDDNIIYKEVDYLTSQENMDGIYFYRKEAQSEIIYTVAVNYDATATYYQIVYDDNGNIQYDENDNIVYEKVIVKNESQFKKGKYYIKSQKLEVWYSPTKDYNKEETYYTLRKNLMNEPEFIQASLVTEELLATSPLIYYIKRAFADGEYMYIPISQYDKDVTYYQLMKETYTFTEATHIRNQNSMNAFNYYIKKESGLEEYSPDTIYTIYSSYDHAVLEDRITIPQDIEGNYIYTPLRFPETLEEYDTYEIKEADGSLSEVFFYDSQTGEKVVPHSLLKHLGEEEPVWRRKEKDRMPYVDGRDINIRYNTINYGLEITLEGLGTQEMDLQQQKRIVWTSLPRIESLKMDNGLYATYEYQQREYVYGIEEDDPYLAGLKSAWLFAQNELDILKASEDVSAEDVKFQEQEVYRTKTEFLMALEEALKQ